MTDAGLKSKLKVDSYNALFEDPEICVWMTLYGGLRVMLDTLVEYNLGKIPKREYILRTNEALIEFVEVADITHRFGIVLPATIEPHYRKRHPKLDGTFVRVDFAPAFWRWYNWWDDYLKGLDTHQREVIYTFVMDRLDVTDTYRPTGDWLNYRSTSPIAFS